MPASSTASVSADAACATSSSSLSAFLTTPPPVAHAQRARTACHAHATCSPSSAQNPSSSLCQRDTRAPHAASQVRHACPRLQHRSCDPQRSCRRLPGLAVCGGFLRDPPGPPVRVNETREITRVSVTVQDPVATIGVHLQDPLRARLTQPADPGAVLVPATDLSVELRRDEPGRLAIAEEPGGGQQALSPGTRGHRSTRRAARSDPAGPPPPDPGPRQPAPSTRVSDHGPTRTRTPRTHSPAPPGSSPRTPAPDDPTPAREARAYGRSCHVPRPGPAHPQT